MAQKSSTKKANAAAAAASEKKAYVSENSFALTGRICERGLKIYRDENGKITVARFTVAHNFGKNSGLEPLYKDVVMFAKNGKKDVAINESLLVKGQPVRVSGYQRSGNWTDEKGGKHYRIDNVGLTLEAIGDAAADTAAESDPEAEA